jgi:histidine decarboxylase
MNIPADPCALTADAPTSAVTPEQVIQALLEDASAGAPTAIGFPGAVDIDYAPVLPLFARLFNNVGDSLTPPGGTAHTAALERDVIGWCADLLGFPDHDRWGYVAPGGTESNLAALLTARRRFPGSPILYSRAAHYSIPKAIEILDADGVVVDVDDRDEMDYDHLDRLLADHGGPVIIAATAGTTMTEAVDDVDRIRAVLRWRGIDGYHLHVDAALSGIPLALDGRFPAADSVAISGHKFFGTPIPCAVVITKDSIRTQARHVAYTATRDSTISGSRSGQAAALLWYGITTAGLDGHQRRAAEARALAAYTADRLVAAGWPAWRHPHAFTVVLATPPPEVTTKWLLASDGPRSHIICMPGVSRRQIDAFVHDVAAVIQRERQPAA